MMFNFTRHLVLSQTVKIRSHKVLSGQPFLNHNYKITVPKVWSKLNILVVTYILTCNESTL